MTKAKVDYLVNKTEDDPRAFRSAWEDQENQKAETNPAIIKVLGVGGGGSNAVDRMVEKRQTSVEYISFNTDIKSLRMSKAHKIIQIGQRTTGGRGAGAQPEAGEKAALESERELGEAIAGADMVFIAAGMGGGTGTGAAPVIARIAKEMDILTVGVVTKPFAFEGAARMVNANAGIEKMKPCLDSLVVILNSNLIIQAGRQMSLLQSFGLADEVLRTGIQSITDTIYVHGLVSLDFADVRTVMKDKGLAHMGIGIGKGSDKAVEAAQKAVGSPLLETSIDGATSLLVNITGCEDMGIFEVDKAMDEIRKHIDKNAEIILGAALDPDLQDEMQITLIATGINGKTGETYRTIPEKYGTTRVSNMIRNSMQVQNDRFCEADYKLEIPSFIRNKANFLSRVGSGK